MTPLGKEREIEKSDLEKLFPSVIVDTPDEQLLGILKKLKKEGGVFIPIHDEDVKDLENIRTKMRYKVIKELEKEDRNPHLYTILKKETEGEREHVILISTKYNLKRKEELRKFYKELGG